MSLIYNKIQRGNPSDVTAPKRWFPLLKSTGLMKEREIAQLLADETTLNPKEAEMAVSLLFKVTVAQLLNGKTVQLGSLGSFRLTASAVGSDTEAEVTASKIKKLNIRFTASDDLKTALKKAKYIDAATIKL